MVNVLVVDDEEDTRISIRDVLESEDYEVSEAKNAEECLEIARREEPDIILLDIMMPGMKVKDLVRELGSVEKLKNIKIIYLTAVSISEEEKKKIMEPDNIVGFIQKPFDMDELLKIISMNVAKRG